MILKIYSYNKVQKYIVNIIRLQIKIYLIKYIMTLFHIF